MAKPHQEFFAVSMDKGSDWRTPPGYPDGFKEKILSSDLNELAKTGLRSRLLRIEPGAYTTRPFVHEHWEEVFLFEGDLSVGNDERGEGGESFSAFTYAVRPPGVSHGPFASRRGCLLFELHYYQPRA